MDLNERAERWEHQELGIPGFLDNPGIFPVAASNEEKQRMVPLRLDRGPGIASGERHRQHGLLWKMYTSLTPQNPMFARKLAESVELEIFRKSRSNTDYCDFHFKKAVAVKTQEDILKILERK